MRNENTKQTKGATNMKFQVDKDFDWKYNSTPFTIVKVQGDNAPYEMLVRWSYENMYGFSDYDKQGDCWTGRKCNMGGIKIEFLNENNIWLEFENYDPMVTKRDMMNMINFINEKFVNEGHDFSGKVVRTAWSDIWKIKESK